jgi:hypothetical protein
MFKPLRPAMCEASIALASDADASLLSGISRMRWELRDSKCAAR